MSRFKRLIPVIIWSIITAYLFFSCEKDQNVPRGTIENLVTRDTAYGLITVEHTILDKFTMLGARSNGVYYRITITQTNTNTRTYVDTAFFVETPKHFVTSFKAF